MPPNLRVEKQKALIHLACIWKDKGRGNLEGGGRGKEKGMHFFLCTPLPPLPSLKNAMPKIQSYNQLTLTTAWRGATGRPGWGANCSAEGCGKLPVISWFAMASLCTIGRWIYELDEALVRPNKEAPGSDACSLTPLLYRHTCMLFTAKLKLRKQILHLSDQYVSHHKLFVNTSVQEHF